MNEDNSEHFFFENFRAYFQLICWLILDVFSILPGLKNGKKEKLQLFCTLKFATNHKFSEDSQFFNDLPNYSKHFFFEDPRKIGGYPQLLRGAKQPQFFYRGFLDLGAGRELI